MTKKQYQQLENRIQKILALNQLEDLASEISFCLEQQELSQEEYDLLQDIKKTQLKLILDLNLLPDYEFIARSLEQKSSLILAKADPGEILLEEFQIIEQELINLNLTRVKFIQNNYG